MRVETGERFEILEKLGEGGLGVVYRARDAAAGREVALKVLHERARGEDAHLRFKQEFRAMSRLHHPNLCTVHDFGIAEDGAPYISMELVPGQDLTASGPVAPARLLELLPPLARALGYLHRQGLVHGDLKPENVRVTPEGDVKLMDLGFLMAAGQATSTPRGTLAYMSPEVVRGDRVDQRADIYALGAMCYHLLAGSPPFAGDTPLDVLRAHLTRRPRPLREIDDGVPPVLEQAIAKMMAREPVARPQSLAEALASLGLAIEDDAGSLPLAGAFVGRHTNLSAFQDALRGLRREARGREIWLTGANGIGKTRLLEELRVLAQLEEVPFLLGGCGDRGAPYGPFVRILRQILPTSREALAAASPEQRAALGLLLPEIAGAGEGAAQPLEPQEERIVIQSAIAHLLRAAGSRVGAVIALDDWHRADAASVETLGYLRRNAQNVPFVIVGLGRDAGYLPPTAQALPPLEAAEVGALAASMLGAGRVPEAFAAALFRWTGGHPGHVQRVVEHLLRTEAMRREGDRWIWPADFANTDLGADFREMVLAPLATLTGPAGQLAELTAVLGSGADLPSLAGLSGLDEESMFAALDELRARQILVTAPAGGHLEFASGGLEDAVYGRIAEGRRIWLHAAAAARLETSLTDDPPADVAARTALARHYLRSRQSAKALPAARLAADLNLAVFAIDAARALLRDALALVADMADQHEAARLQLMIRLAQLERWRGDFEAMEACLDEALPVAERVGDPGPLASLLVLQSAAFNQRMTPASLARSIEVLERAAGLDYGGDAFVQARGRFFLGQAHFFLGQTTTARAAFEAAATHAEASGLPFWRAKNLAFLGYLEATGDKQSREAGLARMAEATLIQASLGDRAGQGFTAALASDAQLTLLRLPDAEAATTAQIAVSEELGVREDHITGLANLATVHALAGRYRKAIEVCERALVLATQYGHPVGLLARAVSGYALAGAGDLRRAEAALTAAEAAGRGEGGYMFSHAVPFLLEGWLRLGRPDEARRVADEARYLFRAHPNQGLQAQTIALLAEARLDLGDRAGATAASEEAWREARECDLALPKLLALRARARVALASGRNDEARQAAEQVQALAERAGACALAAEASGLCGEAALTGAGSDASSRFRAMQAYADREGVPFLRALALHGQANADTDAERNEAMLLEAQQIIRSLAEGLEPLARQAFLGSPTCARVLADRLMPVEPLSIEGGQLVFDRIKSVSQDLLGFANQYGALFREWVASNRQLEMLNALARRINQSLELDDVLPQVVALTLELTKAERALVLLAENGDPARLKSRAGLDDQGRELVDARVSTSICRNVLTSGHPVAVLDATLSEELQNQASVAELDLRTLMCVPLTARGQTLGVLYVDSRAVVATFTRKDLELLTAIASHASVAIGNAMIFAESQQRSEELSKALDMYREAMRQANTDQLTGLNNRRCFEEMSARELDATRRYQRHLSVVLVDVDHFKSFNDTYGHGVGDEVLRAVAGVLARAARVCDVPARLGGEEFVVLCPETTPEGATVLAERIRKNVAALELTDAQGQPVRQLTVSLGIAAFAPDDPGIQGALERADQALYFCKRSGRNQHRIWSADLAALAEPAAAAPGGDEGLLEVVVPAATPEPAPKSRRKVAKKGEKSGS